MDSETNALSWWPVLLGLMLAVLSVLQLFFGVHFSIETLRGKFSKQGILVYWSASVLCLSVRLNWNWWDTIMIYGCVSPVLGFLLVYYYANRYKA